MSDEETKAILRSILWAVRYLCVVLFILMVMVGFGLMAFLLGAELDRTLGAMGPLGSHQPPRRCPTTPYPVPICS